MGGDYEDKIEAKPEKPAKRKAIGLDESEVDEEVNISGIRFHKNGGFVHFHDDKAGVKVYVPVAVWWREWQRLRNPADANGTMFSYQDIDNESTMVVKAVLDMDSRAVHVTMSVGSYVPPRTYDRAWHALDTFTNRASGS